MVLRRKIATERCVLFSQDQIYKSSLPFLFHFRAETSPHSHSLLTSLKAVLFLTMGLYPDALFCITSASLHLTTRSVYKTLKSLTLYSFPTWIMNSAVLIQICPGPVMGAWATYQGPRPWGNMTLHLLTAISCAFTRGGDSWGSPPSLLGCRMARSS